jgi:hypothetical protein
MWVLLKSKTLLNNLYESSYNNTSYIYNDDLLMNIVHIEYIMDFIVNCYKEHLFAFRIQNRWRNARVNPNTKLCQKRLEREMDELGLVSEPS